LKTDSSRKQAETKCICRNKYHYNFRKNEFLTTLFRLLTVINNEKFPRYFAVSNKKNIFAVNLMVIKLIVIKLFEYEVLR